MGGGGEWRSATQTAKLFFKKSLVLQKIFQQKAQIQE